MSKAEYDLDRKVSMLQNRMLNRHGVQLLTVRGLTDLLAERLLGTDLEALANHEVFVNVVYSPASQNRLRFALSENAQIITVDWNFLRKCSPEEGVAIILHEIGHAMNPSVEGLEADFVADQFAVDHGMKDAVIDSLERGKRLMEAEFVNERTEQRLKKLRL